jgi:hypothetical protein
MDAQFADSVSDRRCIAHMAIGKTVQAGGDQRPRSLILEPATCEKSPSTSVRAWDDVVFGLHRVNVIQSATRQTPHAQTHPHTLFRQTS